MVATDKLFTWLFQSQPHRAMTFGDPAPVEECLERRVRWLELQPALADPTVPPPPRSRSAVSGTELEPQIADATAAVLLARFTTRPIPEICAMGGIPLEDFPQSVAYKEIFGLGEERGCAGLTPTQEARIRALPLPLPLPQLEALAEALLDVQGQADLEHSLSAAL